MDEFEGALGMLFILSLVLVAVAYYVGFSTDLKTFFAGLNSIGNTFTGRNQQGQFAGYPTGGATNMAAQAPIGALGQGVTF